jgi:hypothetical protein
MVEGSGSIALTSGSGSGRPKNMGIRWIRNTEKFRKVIQKWLLFGTENGCESK